MEPPRIFDRTLRRARRDRAARSGRTDFLRGLLDDELLDRLADVTLPFADALDLGTADGGLGDALEARGMRVARLDAGGLYAARKGGLRGDEDRPAFADGSFDLIVSAGGIDQVDDLPGALALARRALRPDGLFLAAFFAAGSLPALRRAMASADAVAGAAAPRFHPQIDVRAAGDLLGRAGFALPVADRIGFDLRYPDLFALVADLRANAATNILVERSRRPLSRLQIAAAAAEFADQADADGRTREHLEAVVLTGWAPSPSQPKPAPRGSGARSLADALRPRER